MSSAAAWILVAQMAAVACVAGSRLLRTLRGRLPAGRGAGALVHLAMALGMASMALPSGGVLPGAALRAGFGAMGAVLAVGSLVAPARIGSAHGRHRLHHAAMCGVMVLMTVPQQRGTAMAAMAPHPAMPGSATAAAATAAEMTAVAPSPLLLAAFVYALAVALASVWRAQAARADPLGHACELAMLTGTVVMLLPLL